MNTEAYRACFGEIAKHGSLTSEIARRATRVGDAAISAGSDVARTVGHTFNPSSLSSGWRSLRGRGKLETGLFVVPSALYAGTLAVSPTDPVSGRRMGPMERTGLIASSIGSGLAGYHVGAGGGFARSALVGVGAGLITDRIARTAGRAADQALDMGGAAPPARGVV